MIINIEDINVEIQKFKWLMDRLTTEEFKQKDPKIYKVLMEKYGSKETLLNSLETQYETYLDLPILVEKTSSSQYKIRDGRRRLTVLVHKGYKTVKAILYKEGWGKTDWENGILLKMLYQKILNGKYVKPRFPQEPYLHGDPPFNLYLHGGPYKENLQVDSFLISTGIKVPHIIIDMDKIECRGDKFKRVWDFQIEFLVGKGKHYPIKEQWGTQPFNTYLVGHFDHTNKRIMIQQYFRGGCWGLDVPYFKYNGVPTVKEQIAQDKIGIPLLYNMEIIKPDTPIYYADQSADKPCALEDYFKTFAGTDSLQQYLKWLPTYLKKCRSNHFNQPIEQVIQCLTH